MRSQTPPPPRQPLLPHAGNQDQDGVGAAGVVVLGYGPQPVVEGAPAQGQALANQAEAAAVVERDRGIEAAPAVELHVRPAFACAGRHRGGEAVDDGHRVHPADEQRQPLPGHRIGAHEVRGSLEAKELGGFADALSRQVVPLARRQVSGAVADPPYDTVGQQAGQGAVDG